MVWPLPPSKGDVLSELFPQRNQAYGAAYFRKTYPGTLARAFCLSLTFLGVALLGLHLKIPHAAPVPEDWVTNCGFPPDIDPSMYLKPVPVPSRPRYTGDDGNIYKFLPATRPERYMLAFVPPLVVPDSLLPDFSRFWYIVEDSTTADSAVASQSEPVPTALFEQFEDIPAPNTDIEPDSCVFDSWDVQQQPAFPGGMQALMQYLYQNLRYPEAARTAGIGSQVVVSFVVDTDGNIGAVTVLQDPGGGLGEEVVRVVSVMPRWLPGEANGQPVRVRFLLPVRFELR